MGLEQFIEMILSYLNVFYNDGDTVEIRAFGVSDGKYRKKIKFGYFQELKRLAFEVADYSTCAEGVYLTLNPVNPALHARAATRMKDAGRGSSTSDKDILRRRWLLFDFDPVRPSGISSTDEEHKEALLRACLGCARK